MAMLQNELKVDGKPSVLILSHCLAVAARYCFARQHALEREAVPHCEILCRKISSHPSPTVTWQFQKCVGWQQSFLHIMWCAFCCKATESCESSCEYSGQSYVAAYETNAGWRVQSWTGKFSVLRCEWSSRQQREQYSPSFTEQHRVT